MASSIDVNSNGELLLIEGGDCEYISIHVTCDKDDD